MHPDFSSASWISSSVVGGAHTVPPAPYFRKTFFVDQPIRSARLAITALGLYEAEVNGKIIGNQIFAPGWTDYTKRVQYQVHDVTDLLREGENVLGAILGEGWYCGTIGWDIKRQNYGVRPLLMAQLEIEFRDGTRAVIATDRTWKTTVGPILENDLLMGESYDARQELGAWSQPGFDASGWWPVSVHPAPEIELSLSEGPPVRRIEELFAESPRLLSRHENELRIFDLKQNFCGRVRITVRAQRGVTVVLRFAEILNPDGTLYTENLRGARATDHYTCKGDVEEKWEPRFTFHGFRYVEVSGLQAGNQIEVVGVVLHSDMTPIGDFSCSNELLNQLQSNIVWGQKSNFLEVPTDCPQRDERLGWTGDAQIFVRTAAFNMDVREFFHKWMRDIRDAQSPAGGIPPVVPKAVLTMEDGGPAWSDAVVICPWTIYVCYGDRKILEDNYEAMARYINFIEAKCSRELIRSYPEMEGWRGFGDWLALDGGGKMEGITPKDLIGTAFFAHDACLMARIAAILGKTKESLYYHQLHEQIVSAFQRRFVTPDGLIVSGTQTAHVLALRFDLLPDAVRSIAAKTLARDVKERGFHLGTGFVGTPYILDVLEEHGHLDVAYRLLEQESFPSWLFPVNNGATTIWERWDGWTPENGPQDKGMNSYNHYAYGAVGAWMVRSVAGLDLDPEEPGYRHIILRPRPGGTLAWAQASLITPLGMASIRWDLKDENLEVSATVPEGARASLSVPPTFVPPATLELPPGNHRLTLKKSPASTTTLR